MMMLFDKARRLCIHSVNHDKHCNKKAIIKLTLGLNDIRGVLGDTHNSDIIDGLVVDIITAC
jgi:hypothetical protein